jgi:hypothetical protein
MAAHENVTLQSCKVRVVNGVAAAIVDRFCVRDQTLGREDEMITHVPAAAGAPAQGVIGMAPDTRPFATSTGTVVTNYVRPDGCEAVVELAEAVPAPGTKLRVGGAGAEVKGAAYLADASGDYVVGISSEAGAVGQKIRFQFINLGLLP